MNEVKGTIFASLLEPLGDALVDIVAVVVLLLLLLLVVVVAAGIEVLIPVAIVLMVMHAVNRTT